MLGGGSARSWQLGVRVLAAQGAGHCVPASPPEALLAGGSCRPGSQGLPAQPCRERGFWSRMSAGKRRVGGTCHAGHEGVMALMMMMMKMVVVVTVGGRHTWCRAAGHVTPLFSLWRGYLGS